MGISSDASIVRGLAWIAGRVPIPQGLLRHLADAGCVVLSSHAVIVDQPPPHLRWIVPCKTAARFESDLAWLQRRYQFVGYPEVEASLAGDCPLPKNAALLTFDDGYAELHSLVWPLLRRHGVPALAFLTTSQIDNAALSADCKTSLCVSAFMCLDGDSRGALAEALKLPSVAGRPSTEGRRLRSYLRHHDEAAQALWHRFALDELRYLRDRAPYLTGDQVKEMSADGWSFGGHATVHRPMQDLSLNELESEIVDSCSAAAGLAGQAGTPFAFPYTGEGVRRDWLAQIRDRHPEVGLFFDVWGLRREGSLVWHRVGIENPSESIATTMRRAYLVALVRG